MAVQGNKVSVIMFGTQGSSSSSKQGQDKCRETEATLQLTCTTSNYDIGCGVRNINTILDFTGGLFSRERGNNGLFITLVPKFYNDVFLFVVLIGWFFNLSDQTFQPVILIYKRGNFVYHH